MNEEDEEIYRCKFCKTEYDEQDIGGPLYHCDICLANGEDYWVCENCKGRHGMRNFQSNCETCEDFMCLNHTCIHSDNPKRADRLTIKRNDDYVHCINCGCHTADYEFKWAETLLAAESFSANPQGRPHCEPCAERGFTYYGVKACGYCGYIMCKRCFGEGEICKSCGEVECENCGDMESPDWIFTTPHGEFCVDCRNAWIENPDAYKAESFSADSVSGLLTSLVKARKYAGEKEQGYDYQWKLLNMGQTHDIDLSMSQLERRSELMGKIGWTLSNLIEELSEESLDLNAESFSATVINKGKVPKGSIAKAMMNQAMITQVSIEAVIEELENRVNLGLISEDDLMKSLKKKFNAETFAGEMDATKCDYCEINKAKSEFPPVKGYWGRIHPEEKSQMGYCSQECFVGSLGKCDDCSSPFKIGDNYNRYEDEYEITLTCDDCFKGYPICETCDVKYHPDGEHMQSCDTCDGDGYVMVGYDPGDGYMEPPSSDSDPCGECYDGKVCSLEAESFSAESNELEESKKRTKMSMIRTGLAITTFGIVLFNLWTNKKQEKDISDIMDLV